MAYTVVRSYPTAFTEYPNSYWWSGVLRTKTNNRFVCATATAARQLEFESHPSYDSIDHSSHLYYPKDYLNGSNLDGNGYVFGKVPIQILNFYEHAFPGEIGFSSCSETRLPLPSLTPFTTTTYVTITRTLPFVIEPNVYRQPTVTQTLVAPTPMGGGIKSAVSVVLPTPLAEHNDKGKDEIALVLHQFELRDNFGFTPDCGTGYIPASLRMMRKIYRHARREQPAGSAAAEVTTTTTTQIVATETTVTQTQPLNSTTSTTSVPSSTTRRLPPPFDTMTPQIQGQMGAFTVHTEIPVTVEPLKPFGAFTVRTEFSVTSALSAPTPLSALPPPAPAPPPPPPIPVSSPAAPPVLQPPVKPSGNPTVPAVIATSQAPVITGSQK